jgi:hypothetical protein
MNQESTTRRAETPLEKRVISIINAAINEHNELSVASYGELVHRVVKLVEGQSAPAPQPVLDAGEWHMETDGIHGWRVVDATGREIVGNIYRESDAAQIVSGHTSAAAVAKLVQALKEARALIASPDELARLVSQAPVLKLIDEALTTVQGKEQG